MNWILYGGGLDSTALALYYAKELHPNSDTQLIFVDYGQKAADAEWEAALTLSEMCENIGCHKLHADLSFSKSAIMTGGIATDRKDNRLEYRNPFLVMLAASYIASSNKQSDEHTILLGFHYEHDMMFPDASAHWLVDMNALLEKTSGVKVQVRAPFHLMQRTEIAKLGLYIDPDFFEIAHTCYEYVECGKCKHCLEKQEMIKAIKGEAQ